MIEHEDEAPDLRRPHLFVRVMIAALAVIVVRLWYLQIVRGPELQAQSEAQRTRVIRREVARGVIVDRKGRVLATSRPHYVISVLPDEVARYPQVLPALAAVIGRPVADLASLIGENRTTPFDLVPVYDDADVGLITRIEELGPDLPGVFIERDPKRVYTDGGLCSHVLGTVGSISADELARLRPAGYRGGDIVGQAGIEASYERDLHGTGGGQRIEVDATGRMRHVLADLAAQPGHTLQLNIDLDLQRAAYDALQVELRMGHPGAAIAMDPLTGAVLCLQSVPGYDLNTFTHDYHDLLAAPMKPLIDRATSGRYPNGSTFKIITAAAGLQGGQLGPGSSDYCSGVIEVGRRKFHCDKRSGHGSIGIVDAIGKSCDVFFWHAAQRIGTAQLDKWAHAFGLGERTGIDLPPTVEARGVVPSPDWKARHKLGPWEPGDLLNMAIGQGYVGVTPIQLACYTCAIANGGTLFQPRLVDRVVDTQNGKQSVVRVVEPSVRRQLDLSQETLRVIRAGMVRAMEAGGTAATSGLPGVAIAGKTGSAEVIIKGTKTTDSVFTCFAPAEHPSIVVTVLVEGGGHGADAAAPIARRILARYFHLDAPATAIGRQTSGVD